MFRMLRLKCPHMPKIISVLSRQHKHIRVGFAAATYTFTHVGQLYPLLRRETAVWAGIEQTLIPCQSPCPSIIPDIVILPIWIKAEVGMSTPCSSSLLLPESTLVPVSPNLDRKMSSNHSSPVTPPHPEESDNSQQDNLKNIEQIYHCGNASISRHTNVPLP